MADPAVPGDGKSAIVFQLYASSWSLDQPDDDMEVEVEVEANTSIGSTRPSRKAAQEATKKIEAGKVKIEDNATKKGKGKGKAKVMSDSESEEEEIKPKTKERGKGKGKKVEIASDAESEFEVETKPTKGGKKQILAKAVYWKDIPKWSKGSKSLLMELPGDIMDNIFGLREELGVSFFSSFFTSPFLSPSCVRFPNPYFGGDTGRLYRSSEHELIISSPNMLLLLGFARLSDIISMMISSRWIRLIDQSDRPLTN
jgi:hypothetical protein